VTRAAKTRTEPQQTAPTAAALRRDSERQGAEMAALRRMIDASRGTFSFSVAVCNSPALRDYLIAQFRQSFTGIKVLSVPAGTVDVYGYATDQSVRPAPTAIFLVGLEASIRTADARTAIRGDDAKPSREPTTETRHTLRSLNASRDLWQDRFACPVVLWLPEYAAVLLARTARDLWRYVSHHFEFVAEQTTAALAMTDRFAGNLGAAADLTAQEKRFRIAELEQRIAEAGVEPPKALLPHLSIWLGELAFLYGFVGDLDRAEEMYRKGLALDEALGRKAGMASDYGNLGILYRTRGDLDRAEEMYRKSLALDEELGRKEGMANAYGNLGNLYLTRGDLDRAEEMYRKGLALDEELGRKKGMANAYGNLGVLYADRGDLDRAEEMYRKGLALDEALGRKEGMATNYGNLGILYRIRGDLDRAEEMYRKSLALDEELGRKEGMANAYGNLGILYRNRGEVNQAETFLERSLALFREIGAKDRIAQAEGLLRHLRDR
jgi:tetratricopeptide (TPR) repeat protein